MPDNELMTDPETHETYEIELGGTGPKTCVTASPDEGLPELTVASPPSFGGPGETWTPEHLFVVALSSCLMTTFRTIADIGRLEVLGYSDRADGRLVRDENRLFRIDSVTLRPTVQVRAGADVDKARRLLEKAEAACLISRSVSARVVLEPTVEVIQHGTAAR